MTETASQEQAKQKTALPPEQSDSSGERVTRYARDVVAGRVVAGQPVLHACERHLRDLESDDPQIGEFHVERAADAIDFIEQVCCLNGGEFEGVPFKLLDWQAFIVGSIFGWLLADGVRRFRTAYVETAKGSGKSPLAAAIGLYMLVADGESRAEVYSIAAKLDQAKILFRDACAMVRFSPQLIANVAIQGPPTRETNLAYYRRASWFRPLASGEEEGQSGIRPHCGLVDELHEHRTDTALEMLDLGKKMRRNPLTFMITNAGSDPQSPCGRQNKYARDVAAGVIRSPGYFSYVCALDDTDDPLHDELCWGKTNPSLHVGLPTREYLREQVTKAVGMPSRQSRVLRLNFCKWVNAVAPWLDVDTWMRAADSGFDPNRLLGRACWGGLDLSSTIDLTSLVLLFEPVEDDPFWRQKSWFWIPEDRIQEKVDTDGVPFDVWVDTGAVNAEPGRAISKAKVLAQIWASCQQYDVQQINYDRDRIEDLLQLAADDDEIDDDWLSELLQPFGQGFRSMGPAVDKYEEMLEGDELRHDGNPCMTWNAANAVIVQDDAGGRKPTKKRSVGRIDGVVASVMAAGGVAKGVDSQTIEQGFATI